MHKNFIMKTVAFGLVLCMGFGSLDLSTFAATAETVETGTAETSEAEAGTEILPEQTVEEVADLYTEDDLSEAAETSGTTGLLVQLKDAEGTLPGITYNSTNSVDLSNGLYAVTFASAKEAEAAKEELSSNEAVSFVEDDTLVESEAEVVSTESVEATEVAEDTESTADTEIADTEDIESSEDVIPDTEVTEETEAPEQEEDTTVKVAVLDSGVDYSKDAIVPYVEDTGINLSASGESNSTSDDNGHGTAMVSALLDAYGCDDGIKVYPIKVLDSNNRGTILSTYLGIKAAIEMDVDVINLSLSAKTQSKLLEEAVNEAYAKGIMVVGAAGNNGSDLKDYAPANIMNAVIVSSVNAKKEVCAYSNYGNGLDFAAYGKYTDAGTTYRGTSVSAAKVSGILAEVIKEQPEADTSTLYQSLISRTEKLTEEWDYHSGYGLLGGIPSDAADDAEDTAYTTDEPSKETPAPEADVVQGAHFDGQGTAYASHTGHFTLDVYGWGTEGKYLVDLKLGYDSDRINGVNYPVYYTVTRVGGSDMGLDLQGHGGSRTMTITGSDCYEFVDPSWYTSERQYVIHFLATVNKVGYHAAYIKADGLQVGGQLLDDGVFQMALDTNGCGLTNFSGVTSEFQYATYTLQCAPNTYTVNFNGNGATGGSMSPQTMLYNTASAISNNGFTKSCTATFNGNGGTPATGSATASCPFNGWYDYNDITVNGNTYHWWTFDAPYYVHTYSDVANAYGYNKVALASHFDQNVANGSENRQSSPVFNIGYYQSYGGNDLKSAFGSNRQSYISHWNANGYAEGRKGVQTADTSGREVYPNGVTVVNLTTHINDQLWLYASWGKAKVTLPTATKTGYQLVGWSTNKNATTAEYAVGQTVEIAANTTFYAVWKNSNPPKIIRIKNVQDGNDAFWTYVYVQDTGNGVARVQFPIWTAANGQDDIFPNWGTSTAAKGTKGSWTIDGVSYNYRYHTETSKHNDEHTEYYTHAYAYDKYGGYSFIAGNFKFRYDVTVNKGDHISDVSGGGTYYYDDKVTVSATLPDGYKFKDWTGTLTSTSKDFTFKLPVGGATLTANGVPIEYNVSFDGNGATDGSMNDIHLVYDEDTALPPNQFKRTVEGRESTFVGWSTSPDTSPKDVPYKDGDTVKNLTKEDGDTVKLYAIWDDAPSLEAIDLYYSRKQADEGKITEEDIMKYVYAYDKEDGEILPGEHEDGSHLIITNLGENDFDSLTVSVTETIEAKDSCGNVTRTVITIYIVKTYVEDITHPRIRFINEYYYYQPESHGGLSPDSVWKTDPEYVACIEDAFRREREHDPVAVTYISAEEIQEANKDLHDRARRENEARKAAQEAEND